MKKIGLIALVAKLKHLVQLTILTGVIFGCSKDQDQIVPHVRVDLSINLQLPQFSELNSVNNAVIYPKVGYNLNGVIIYRNSTDEFTAYDATCPQHIETKTAVVLDDNGSAGSATCQHCKTVYLFFNYAYPSKGYPLKQYKVSMSGSGSFLVTN